MIKKTIHIHVDKHISKRLRITTIGLPIIVGVAIFLWTKSASWISFWLSHKRMPKGGFTGYIVGAIVECFFEIIPFVVIAMIIRDLIRKGAGMAEIYLKSAFMLLPVSIVTTFWLYIYIDPFVRGFLLFVNICILLVGLLISKVICKTTYCQESNGYKKREDSSKDELQHKGRISIIGSIAITLIPVVVGTMITLLSIIYYYLAESTLLENIHSIISVLPGNIIGTCPFYIIISGYTFYLIRKSRSKQELVIKILCMLLPVAAFNFYWYSRYLLTPLAFMYFPTINLFILTLGWLIGLAISNAFKDKKNK